MCGIAGFIGTDRRLDELMLKRMLAAQRHRGPDDSGVMYREIKRDSPADPPLRMGMAHNRLSILDLSKAGHQPMSNGSGNSWLCYNGEFYNSPSCRRELKRQGEEFTSTSDTEVLLHMCRLSGVREAATEVNGMFAFGFLDVRQEELTLCRDRAGQKPLFYIRLPDESLIFASEIPALLASGLVPEEFDVDAFDQYWTLGYTSGERTFYKSIRRLPPGSLLRWRDKKVDIQAYWKVVIGPDDAPDRPEDDYIDECVSLLTDAVQLRLLSDVPVGICLSGGIDSTLIALMISRLRADVPAYTIAFEGTPIDEAQHASAIAKHLGIQHQVLNVSGDLAGEFPGIASWYGEPFGDASSIPMFYLAQMIREHATVALTGDGADELFGGYHHYRDGMRVWGKGYFSRSVDPQGLRGRMRDMRLRVRGVVRGYEHMQRHVNDELKTKIYANGLPVRDTAAELRSGWLSAGGDPMAAMQNCDFHVYMTDDVLAKVDRMSMAHSLECRSPFMDHRVIEWAARLPTRMKLSSEGSGKYILRSILSRFMPLGLYDRPKQGFTPPWERWCVGALRAGLRSDWPSVDDGLVKASAVDELAPEKGDVSPVLSWMAYSYVQWRQKNYRPFH